MRRAFSLCLPTACLLSVCLLAACENWDLPLGPFIDANTKPKHSDKAITQFFIISPVTAPGAVNEAAGTVTVTVSYGTDVSNMTPFITHTGVSISPASETAQNFTNAVTYRVTAEDGSYRDYTVTVAVSENNEDFGPGVSPSTFTVYNQATWKTAIDAINVSAGNYIINLTGSFSLTSESSGGAALNPRITSNSTVSIRGNSAITLTANGNLLNISTGAVILRGPILLGKSSNNNAVVRVSGGRFYLRSGTISSNTNTSTNGGGVYVDGGTFTMSGGTISGNYSSGNGGGVYVDGGTFTMSDGTISGNNGGSGGGVYVNMSGSFGKTGGTITGTDGPAPNIASSSGAAVYVNTGPKYRNITAGPGVNMDSSIGSATTPPWVP